MNLRSYPYPTHLIEDIHKQICSEHGGILQSLMVSPAKSDDMYIKALTGQMPHYERVLLHPNSTVQYHLTGYGIFYEEAIIRLVGEAIERYALMVSQYALLDKVKFASYKEIQQEGKVIPFEYLTYFSDSDYEKLNKAVFAGIGKLTQEDTIGWLACPSLFNPGETIWVPMQMLFVGYKRNSAVNEAAFSLGFSTGTAAHMSIEKALMNSLMEFIEIDSLMINWYTRQESRCVINDDATLLKETSKVLGDNTDYNVLTIELTTLDNVDAHVFGTVLINKKEERPYIIYGVQASLNPAQALYRGFMEAAAIRFLGVFGPLYSPEQYFNDPKDNAFTDLDTNVAFWAYPSEAQMKKDSIYETVGEEKTLSTYTNYDTGDTQKDLSKLISQLSKVSEYAVYLDVTPPEARQKGWYVMRTFIPELVNMCVPGVPYNNHPRLNQFGGIKNEFPHPLP